MFWVQVWSNWSGPQTHCGASDDTQLLIFLSLPHECCIYWVCATVFDLCGSASDSQGIVPVRSVFCVTPRLLKYLFLLSSCLFVLCSFLLECSLSPIFQFIYWKFRFFLVLCYLCCLRLLSGHVPQSGIARSYGRFTLSFLRILHTDFYRTCSNSQSQRKWMWALPSPYRCQLFSGFQTFWVVKEEIPKGFNFNFPSF